MVFVPQRWLKPTAAAVAIVATTALLLAGNGMDPVWPLMWVAFIPMLLFAAETHSTRTAFVVAALAMLLGSLNMLHYLHWVLGAPVIAWAIPFSSASLFFAAGVLLFRRLLHRGAFFSALVALPALWTVCEFIASLAPANGTAGSLAYTQLRCLPILQTASLTGPSGITFLLLLFPSAVVAALYARRRKILSATPAVASALAILTLAILFGLLRLAEPNPQQTVRVGLLDTDSVLVANSEPRLQQLVQSYADQADRLAQRGAKIVLMPEKTGLLRDTDATLIDPILQSVVDHRGTTLVIGFVHQDQVAQETFNEARIYTPNQPIATYHKQHMLAPFESTMKPGTTLTLLPGMAVPVGVAICKDMDFMHPALDYGRAHIALLLDPAWDFNVDRIWHGHIAILRGVEGGYAIAHTAKQGLLTVSDDRGRILAEVSSKRTAEMSTQPSTDTFASLLVDVPLRHDPTAFNHLGDHASDWFSCLAALMLLAAIAQAFTAGTVSETIR